MSDQSMMLGVPAGEEPVSTRSLEEKPVEVKPKRKREIRGIVKTSVDNEEYRVEMRETGVTVRRCGKHHTDTKPIREIVDFVTGQGRLEFDCPALPAMESRMVFEMFISAPPFEYSTERFSEDETIAAWPGNYRDISVQLAWAAWQEAVKHGARDGSGTVELPLPSTGQTPFETLLECCIEFLSAHTMQLNDAKYRGRYELAASALKSQVEVLAPGAVEKVMGGL